MDRRIIIIVALILFSIIAAYMLLNFGPSQIMLIPFGFIAISSVFFSRGILIFLALLCLAMVAVPYGDIGKIALQLRWVFLILFCLHVFGDIFLGRTVRRIKFFDILAIFFIIYAFLSTAYSSFHRLTLERTVTISILYISVFWVIWKYAYEQGQQKVVNVILQVMWLIFMAGYLMIFIGPYRPFLGGRFAGIFGNPNGLGVMSAIILPLSLCQFLETKKKSALFLFSMIALSLLLSAARGSINATVIALAYLIYVTSKKYRHLVFLASMSFIFILIWAIETLIKQFFLHYIRVESIPILGGRLEVWPVAIKLIMDKPLFGYGFGTEDKLLALKQIVLTKHSGAYIHNSYLGMLLQLGLPGFIIFFIPLFILLFKELFSKQESQTPLLRYALRASLIAGLICCFYESWIYSVGNAMAFPFWIIVMLLTFYRYQDKEKSVVDSMGT